MRRPPLLIAVLFTVLTALSLNIKAAPGPYYINEILRDPPGADNGNEYIELRGPASGVIPAGTYLIAIEGTGGALGNVDQIFDLGGKTFGTNGFLVLRQFNSPYAVDPNASTFTGTSGYTGLPGFSGGTDSENDSITFILASSPFTTPTVTPVTDIDSNNDGTPDGAFYAGLNVYDSIGILENTVGSASYGLFNISNGSGGTTTVGARFTETFTAAYIARRGNSTGSAASDFYAGSSLGGTPPNVTFSASTNNTFPDSSAGQSVSGNLGATNLAPTAASVPVSGRVLTGTNRPVFGARVYITDMTGATQTAMTNPFGYYRFEGVQVGQTYTFEIFSKRYSFVPQVVTIFEPMENLDFVGN